MDEKYIESLIEKEVQEDSISLSEIIKIIRLNWLLIVIITVLSTAVAVYYANSKPDVYKTTALIRVTKPQGSILEGAVFPEFSDLKSSFVENEIEVMKIYDIRRRVAEALVDTLELTGIDNFSLITKESEENDEIIVGKSVEEIIGMLKGKVEIAQKSNLEIVEISVESASPYEASLICNLYAEAYQNKNLIYNRAQLGNVKEFLKNQVDEKFKDLIVAENYMREFQEKGKVYALDAQAQSLIENLSEFEAKRNAVNIDLSIAQKNLEILEGELSEQEPKMVNYLRNSATEKYLEGLAEEIAKYEVQRDLSLSQDKVKNRNEVLIKGFDEKVDELKEKRDDIIKDFSEKMMITSSKDEIRSLMQEILTEKIKVQSLKASLVEINKAIDGYEKNFNNLPQKTFGLARLERERLLREKLYLLVQEKYQEALVNEQSIPANVVILDPARPQSGPTGPNRKLIIITGFLVGLGLSLGIAFVKAMMDTKIHTPDDLYNMNIDILGWIPEITEITQKNKDPEVELVTKTKTNSISAESYRAIRTRIQFKRRNNEKIKTILVTSPSPADGKTITAANIAAAFGMANRRTLLLDCDLRKPRIHKIFNEQKTPGLTDLLCEASRFSEVIKKTSIPNMFYLASGTQPSNPSEILSSGQIEKLLTILKSKFDYIILDSPPIVAVTDAEILSTLADGTVLVVKANETDKHLVERSIELLRNDYAHLLGLVLNCFVIRNGYSNYYKYYYYYSNNGTKNKKRKKSGLKEIELKT
ncbi:MAG: polysaccharide biosynthesis tyrosine autokinase [Ignavibacteria bacterium]|jgi:tyrosine-protein kinase Etk/Wzc